MAHAPVLVGESFSVVMVMTVLLVIGQWILRDSSLEELVGRFPWWVCSLTLAMILLALVLTPGDDRAFIYFQF
jgi:hypothetical protein